MQAAPTSSPVPSEVIPPDERERCIHLAARIACGLSMTGDTLTVELVSNRRTPLPLIVLTVDTEEDSVCFEVSHYEWEQAIKTAVTGG